MIRSSIRLFTYSIIVFTITACLRKSFELKTCKGITYFHNEPLSILAQKHITRLALKDANSYKSFLNYDSATNRFAAAPDDFRRKFKVDTTLVAGRKVTTLAPKSGASGTYILFIHGGAYTGNVGADWYTNIYAKIIEPTGATLVLPDYGLAPYYTFVQGYAFVQEVYDRLVAQVGAGNIILMGDSAGGGFALGLAQTLKGTGTALPRQIILLAPWLDITLSNPDIDDIDDPYLNARALREAGLAWAGLMQPAHYQLSPINGPLEGLPPISVFIGGRDLFLADVHKLRRMMAAKCAVLTVYEYPKMIHVWMETLPEIPESKRAYEEIADLIKR